MKNILTQKTKIITISILTFMLILFNSFIYAFDKFVTPIIMEIGDAQTKSKVTEIINRNTTKIYNKTCDYNKIIQIDKDKDNNIVMIKADTVKLNKLACDIALESQYDIERLGKMGIKIPIGYALKNNILAYLGPNITIKMEQIGSVETKYISKFESAGINQTRHTIGILVKTKVRVMIPMAYDDIEIKNEIPVVETIIVGKIPNSAIQLDLKNSGFKVP